MRPLRVSESLRRRMATGLAALIVLAGCAAASAAPPRAAMFATRAQFSVTLPSREDPTMQVPDVVHLVNRGGPVEVEARRTPGTRSWTALQVTDGVRLPLHTGVPVGPAGLGRAVVVTVLDRGRRVVRRRALDVCLNDGAVRLGTAGPGDSGFPLTCLGHPFALGLRMGLDTDYGVPVHLGPAIGRGLGLGPMLAPGRYTVRVRMRPATAEWLGMAPADRAVTVGVRVRPAPRLSRGIGDASVVETVTGPVGTLHGDGGSRSAAALTTLAPPADALPDLAALPAYSIATDTSGTRDSLDFAATVWNAGPGALVVEGYRRGTAPVMDAFQFFRRDEDDVAAAAVGELEYDFRSRHDHWHFRDFARYSLVRGDGRPAAVSPKEAWCLAPTDAIDQLVTNAEDRPGDPSLFSACGDASAAQVREVLEVGAGDTYGNGTPGQAIDITRLRNGVYFLKIEANPAGALRETSATNNVSLRRVVLGGRPGRRTVLVPPTEGIDSESTSALLRRICPTCGF